MSGNAIPRTFTAMLAAGGLFAALGLGCGVAGCQSGARRSGASPGAAAAREFEILVTERGFEPAETRVPPGQEVALVITRKTDRTCATEIVFPSLHRRFDLPLDRPVRMRIPAARGETLSYVCGMNMLGGRIVAQ